MYVIIVFDPVTGEFKEVIGVFEFRTDAAGYAAVQSLENFIIVEVREP